MSEYFRKPIVKTLMLKGQEGQSIKEIKKTNTSGLVDTYTITLTDGTTSTFTVTNGKEGDGLQNLQVGGRNLYQDTKYFNNPSVWDNYSSWTKKDETYNGFAVMTNNGQWKGLAQQIKVKNGEVYTFSAYVKNAEGVNASIYNNIYNNIGGNNIVSTPYQFDLHQSTDFVRYVFTFKAIKDGIINPRIECAVDKANKIEVCGIKLERGNIATDWTPAPEDLKLESYPVGSIYISADSTSPAALFGGTWEQLKDRFLLAAGDTYSAGSTGGESQHTLTREEIPNYNIGDIATVVPENSYNWDNGGILPATMGQASSSTPGVDGSGALKITSGIQYGWKIATAGGNQPHNNMPPYLAVYTWKRVA